MIMERRRGRSRQAALASHKQTASQEWGIGNGQKTTENSGVGGKKRGKKATRKQHGKEVHTKKSAGPQAHPQRIRREAHTHAEARRKRKRKKKALEKQTSNDRRKKKI